MRFPIALTLLLLASAIGGCLSDGGAPGVDDAQTPQPTGADDAHRAVGTNASARPGWPPLGDAAIRPGVDIADGCTSNFLFRSPDNRTLYLGTAAHCVSGMDVGDEVSIAGSLARGVLAYSSFNTMSETEPSYDGGLHPNDFALVAIPEAHRRVAHPAILHYGGPTGVATDATAGDRAVSFGNSSYRDGTRGLDAHEGYVTGRGEWITDVHFVTPGIPGDSGSAVVLADGRALGVLIHLEVAPKAGGNNVVNLAPALAYAREHAGVEAELVTWPVLREPALPDLPTRPMAAPVS